MTVVILILFLILDNSFQIPTIEYNTSCELVTYGFYYIEMFPLYPLFLEFYFILLAVLYSLQDPGSLIKY